jgi:hypothetical protein
MRLSAALVLATLCSAFPSSATRAQDVDAKAVVDKAIAAKGGEKLVSNGIYSWKAKGTITFNGADNDFTSATTIKGINHLRAEFKGEFDGNTFEGVTVLNGEQGWRKFNDMVIEMDGDSIENEKRQVYLQLTPFTLQPLREEGFKLEPAGEQMVDGKPALGVKVTAKNGKDFTVYFDKENGLPVKLIATVMGFMGDEFTQETTFSAYKDFGGLKQPTHIESKRDGEPFVSQDITEFKTLESVPDSTFAEPQ